MAKIVDTLRNLLNNDATRLAQHTLVDESSVDDYLLRGWAWNSSKYGTQRGLRDTVDTLVKVSSDPSIASSVFVSSTELKCIGNDINRQCIEESIEQLQSRQRLPDPITTKERVCDFHIITRSTRLIRCLNSGNLSTKSLVGLVQKEHVTDSEYLETIIVAVPKYVSYD